MINAGNTVCSPIYIYIELVESTRAKYSRHIDAAKFALLMTPCCER